MDANQTSENLAGLGTTGQANYIHVLAKQLGYTSPAEAARDVGGVLPLTAQSASKVIEALKLKVAARGDGSARSGKEGEAPRRRYLTARNLLQIDAGSVTVPDDLDEDAAEVLQRLAKLREVERVIGAPAQWGGVNAGGPILVEHLVRYFGSIEAVAVQFGVGADTVRNWGTNIPQARAFEAQVRTNGHVCAPR